MEFLHQFGILFVKPAVSLKHNSLLTPTTTQSPTESANETSTKSSTESTTEATTPSESKTFFYFFKAVAETQINITDLG